MKGILRGCLASLAFAFAVLFTPVSASTATAAPAASVVDMMRAIKADSGTVTEVRWRHRGWRYGGVGYRRWGHRRWRPRIYLGFRPYHYHRYSCTVRRCYWTDWGHRRCRWVNRCW
ncbi:MAG: hypothetical protein AB7E80_07340 [Hyphomicrobiaceae bacterium]